MEKREERFDAVATSITELKSAMRDLDARMHAGFTEVRSEMHTQFRWVMGGIGGATLAILVTVVAAILAKG